MSIMFHCFLTMQKAANSLSMLWFSAMYKILVFIWAGKWNANKASKPLSTWRRGTKFLWDNLTCSTEEGDCDWVPTILCWESHHQSPSQKREPEVVIEGCFCGNCWEGMSCYWRSHLTGFCGRGVKSKEDHWAAFSGCISLYNTCKACNWKQYMTSFRYLT